MVVATNVVVEDVVGTVGVGNVPADEDKASGSCSSELIMPGVDRAEFNDRFDERAECGGLVARVPLAVDVLPPSNCTKLANGMVTCIGGGVGMLVVALAVVPGNPRALFNGLVKLN